MAATDRMNSPVDDLVAELARSWPAEWTTAPGTPTTGEADTLAALIECARRGEPSSLPYVRRGRDDVLWVSVGSTAKRLLDYAEDLRSWVQHGYGVRGDIEFVRPMEMGRLATLVQAASPQGYLRWTSPLSALPAVMSALKQMQAFLALMPALDSETIPSIHVLRFRFVSALRCSDWGLAGSVIDEIDRWGLEQAHKTMQMRLRLLGESGAHAQLLETVERHHLWSLVHPTRVAESILGAFVRGVLDPLEASLPPADVCESLRPWYERIVQVLPRVTPSAAFARLFAYIACLDKDGPSAASLLTQLTEPLASFVRDRCGVPVVAETPAATPTGTESDATVSPTAPVESAATDSATYWADLQRLVRHGSTTALDLHLSELSARALESPEFLEAVPETLLELVSDPSVDTSAASENALQEVLTALVDVSVSVPGFPSVKHLNLYLSLAEALVYLRGTSAGEEDAHLLHGLLAAIANLSGNATTQCTALLRAWWKARPVLPRLDWLLGVLESLAPLHPEPGSMLDLWAEALDLATRKSVVLTRSQWRLWLRVGGLLELDVEAVKGDLARLRPADDTEPPDPLAQVQWKKIAIVSLQESAAREAAKELQARSGADVVVVTSLVQGGLTKAAEAADVILLVWAACSHAVYRAFDSHRDRLAYVQGTGTSSILSAAEHRAERALAAAH